MGRRKFLAFEGHRMDGMGIGGVGFIRDGYGSTLQVDFGGQVHKYLSIYLTHTISLSLSLYTKIRGGGGGHGIPAFRAELVREESRELAKKESFLRGHTLSHICTASLAVTFTWAQSESLAPHRRPVPGRLAGSNG